MTGLVTNTGLAAVVGAIVAGDTKYLGWGGGTGQGETADDLASAFAESRAAGILAAASTNTAGDTLRVTGTLTATAPRTVTEVGVFSAPGGAAMEVYGEFSPLALATGESIAFTVDVIVDQA